MDLLTSALCFVICSPRLNANTNNDIAPAGRLRATSAEGQQQQSQMQAPGMEEMQGPGIGGMQNRLEMDPMNAINLVATGQVQKTPGPIINATEGIEPTPQKPPIMPDAHRKICSSSGTVAISSIMSASEMAVHLGEHGCKNITNSLDWSSCSVYPVFRSGFGDVYRAMLRDGTPVAVKTMRLQVDPSERGQKPLKDAARELHTWSRCRHPNVVRLLGLVEFLGQIGMVSLWIDNGNLPSYLAKNPDANRCQMSLQISEGLRYLHRSNIIHGDLKGPNVLISNEGIPLLTDFGNAILLERTLQFTSTTVKTSHSPRWAAPEIIEGSGTYSFAADVYALGMTILETITGQVPYQEKNPHAVYFAVAVKREHPKRPEDRIPPDSQHGNTLWSMLTRCWAYEAEARPRVDDVVDIMKIITQEGLVCPVPTLFPFAEENSMFDFLDAFAWDPDESVGDGMPIFEPAVAADVRSEALISIYLGRYRASSERLLYEVRSYFTFLVVVFGGISSAVVQLFPANWLKQIIHRVLFKLQPAACRLAAWGRIAFQLAIRIALLIHVVEPENEANVAQLDEANVVGLDEALEPPEPAEGEVDLPAVQDAVQCARIPAGGAPLMRSFHGILAIDPYDI